METPTLIAISDTETKTGTWITRRTLHARCDHNRTILSCGCLRLKTNEYVPRAATRRPTAARSRTGVFVGLHQLSTRPLVISVRAKTHREKKRSPLHESRRTRSGWDAPVCIPAPVRCPHWAVDAKSYPCWNPVVSVHKGCISSHHRRVFG